MRKIDKKPLQNLEETEAYKKTQLGKIKFSLDKSSRFGYFDRIVKNSAKVPGVGAYFKDKPLKPGAK